MNQRYVAFQETSLHQFPCKNIDNSPITEDPLNIYSIDIHEIKWFLFCLGSIFGTKIFLYTLSGQQNLLTPLVSPILCGRFQMKRYGLQDKGVY